MKIYSLLTILIISLALTACDEPKKKSETVKEKPIPVVVAKVKSGKEVPIEVTGITESTLETKLAFRTGGYLQRIYFKEGESVRKGAKIAELNKTEIVAQVRKAELMVQKTKRDLTRAQELFKDSAVTEELFQNAETAFRVAKSDFEAAQFNLKHSVIYAPVDGKILKRLSERHEFVAPGYPVVIIGERENGWIVTTAVTDRDIIKISIGDSAEISLDALKASKIIGKVSEMSESADPYTSLFKVKIRIDKSTILKSGLIGTVKIYSNYGKELAYIPPTALLKANKNSAEVYTIKGNKITRVPVTVKGLYNGYALISRGLKTTDEVVTEGARYLNDKSTIVRVK